MLIINQKQKQGQDAEVEKTDSGTVVNRNYIKQHRSNVKIALLQVSQNVGLSSPEVTHQESNTLVPR